MVIKKRLTQVTGWGLTVEGSKPSEELKELEVPFIPYGTCYDDLPIDFRRYLTTDKICAGYLQNGKFYKIKLK